MKFHILDFDYKKDERIIDKLFIPIKQRNTILFLGAGASATDENKFLSADVITLYEAQHSINLNTKDIIEFVDILSANPSFSRNEFDVFVDGLLRKLRPNFGHTCIAKLNWKAIITTNYDLLLERAFQEVEGTSEENLKLRLIRQKDEYFVTLSDDEVAYYKINGCIENKRDYPLVFSTEDFKIADTFYKVVLKPLRDTSPKVNFLSIGYSFSDLFSKRLMQSFDRYNYRDKKIIFNVDPYVKEEALPWFEQQNICVVKSTINEFFQQYEKWEEERGHSIKLSLKNYYTTTSKAPIYLPNRKLIQRIDNNLIQLNEHYRSRNISQTDFYKGEEPNFTVIERKFDVIKEDQVANVKNDIFEIVDSNATRIIPIIFLTGTFGTGKSTFTYRLIKSIITNPDYNASAFEIMDPSGLKSADLKDFFLSLHSSYIILYVNTVELSSVFKNLLELRASLSIDNSQEYKVFIVVTIRENILEKLRYNKEISNGHVIQIDCPLKPQEALELVSRLKDCGLVTFRDANERDVIVKKIIREYSGDSYISLLELISGSKLIDDLVEAYDQLGPAAQQAFLYTSMLFQFKIQMPSSLLQRIVSKGWNDFTNDVVGIDGKGILIHDDSASETHVGPDLFFRTKHPLISERLINNILKDEDTKFSYAKKIVTHADLGRKTSNLLINFFKALEGTGYFPAVKINSLYDLAAEKLSEDPHFVLHFAMNLQKRRTVTDLQLAIRKIQYVEALPKGSDLREETIRSTRRNHYLIHRRGVVIFDLAKLYFEENNRRINYKIKNLIAEARDLLEIKQILDPATSYSYYDLISLEIWTLQHLVEDEIHEAKILIRIEEQFSLAKKAVYDNLGKIHELQHNYLSRYASWVDEGEFIEDIDNRFGSEEAYPYGLILKFNYYFENERYEEAYKIIGELEGYPDNEYVTRTLFVYYGRYLHLAEFRVKFFKLIKMYPELEDKDALRYYYFNFIAECYNYNFGYAHELLARINNKFTGVNPDFSREWIDGETGETKIFEGIFKINKNGKKVIQIPEINKYFFFNKVPKGLELNSRHDVILRFFLYGIRVEIFNSRTLQIADDESELIESDDDI